MKTSIFSLLLGKNHMMVNREVARAIGLDEAILLHEILDRGDYHFQRGEHVTIKGKSDWFYITVDDMEYRTTVPRRRQESAIKQLLAMGFIESALHGLPARRFFRINQENVLEFFGIQKNSARLYKTDKLVEISSEKPVQTSSYENAELDRTKTPNCTYIEETKEKRLISSSNEEDTRTREKSPPSSSPPIKEKPAKVPKVKVRDYVELTDDEHEKLKNLWPKDWLEAMLDKLDSYKESTGKKYKSDYATLRKGGWVSEEIISKMQNKQPWTKPIEPKKEQPYVFKPKIHVSTGKHQDES